MWQTRTEIIIIPFGELRKNYIDINTKDGYNDEPVWKLYHIGYELNGVPISQDEGMKIEHDIAFNDELMKEIES